MARGHTLHTLLLREETAEGTLLLVLCLGSPPGLACQKLLPLQSPRSPQLSRRVPPPRPRNQRESSSCAAACPPVAGSEKTCWCCRNSAQTLEWNLLVGLRGTGTQVHTVSNIAQLQPQMGQVWAGMPRELTAATCGEGKTQGRDTRQRHKGRNTIYTHPYPFTIAASLKPVSSGSLSASHRPAYSRS